MYYINLDENNRILSANTTGQGIAVEGLPSGDLSDYIYVNGEYEYALSNSEEENEQWWNENYIKIEGETTSDMNLWVARKTYYNKESYDVLKDDLIWLTMGKAQGSLLSIKLCSYPNMANNLTKQYIESLENEYTEPAIIEEVINYLTITSFNNRQLPYKTDAS